MKKVILIFFALLLSFSLSAENITFSADSMSGTAGNKNDRTTLKGRAKVVTSSITINADTIELYGDNFRYITATGNVSGINNESHMDFNCGKLLYDRDTKLVTLEIGVKLLDNDNDVTAEAELIEYNQEQNIAIMQIDVHLTQKDNVCTSSYAIYRKEDQILDMSGNPQVVQGDDKFKAQEITLNLDTQEITLDGKVRGSITSEESSEPDEAEDGNQNTEAEETPGETTEPAVENNSNGLSVGF